MVFGVISVACCAVLEMVIENSPPKSVPIWWQLPQYIFISLAEALVSVTALEFAYMNAPNNLKTILSAFNLLTTAFGDLFSTIIFSICAAIGDVSRLNQFLIFTAIVFLNTLYYYCTIIRAK